MRRNKELVFISRLLILTFLFQPHAFAAEPGSTPTPQPSVNAECENVCSTYNSEKLKDKIADACGPEPSPSSSPVPITNNGVTFKDFSECKQKIFKDSKEEADGTRVVDKSKINDEFAAKYGALGQYCDAKSLYETGSNWAMYSAIAYTAAAVPCWTACVVEKVPVINVGGPALEIACEVAGVVALGTDIAGTVLVTQEGGKATETWDQWAEAKLGYASTAIGATGVVTGAGTIATRRLTDQGVKSAEALKAEKAAKEATKTASKEAGKQAQEAAIKQGLKADKVALFKKAAEEGTEKAMTKGSEKLSNVGTKGKKLRGISCLTAALFTVTASIKWANYSLNKGHAADMCTKVSNLGSIQTGVQGKLFAPTDIKLDSVLGSTPDSSPSKATPGSPPPVQSDSPTFPQGAIPNVSPALASAFDNLPNRDKIPDALKDLGTSLGDLARQLQSSAPGEVVSSALPFLPSDVAALLKEQDKLAQEGYFSIVGDSGSTFTGGGGGGQGAGAGAVDADPFKFQRRTASGPGADQKSEVSFAKAPLQLPSDGDIWHMSWKGSIFQIISLRLNGSKEKIETLEWASPLNRALLGLPPLKPELLRNRPATGGYR